MPADLIAYTLHLFYEAGKHPLMNKTITILLLYYYLRVFSCFKYKQEKLHFWKKCRCECCKLNTVSEGLNFKNIGFK